MQLLQSIYQKSPKVPLDQLNVLMVGVGGIGCEVLKVISKFQFQEFHIIDMDTIEVSNLNRQFLFRKQHRGQYKSTVAKETMLKMAPQMNIIAHVGAIGTKDYGLTFISKFDIVIMALDNNETRSYINKACKALGIFFLDGGSMGFKGQAKCYYPSSQLRCFDCNPLVSGQQQYAACTIRSQPSTCVHCVIWAKYLFTQLFSEVQKDDESGILEIKNIGDGNALFKQVFIDEITNLKKKAVDFNEIGEIKECTKSLVELQEKAVFPLKELVGIWFYSFNQLKDTKTVYDKDEFIHTLFVFASTQLRCYNFGITAQNYHEIKTISGNIIHAIASTNSMVASLEISKLLHFLFQDIKTFEDLQNDSYLSITAEKIQASSHTNRSQVCSSCFPVQKKIECDFNKRTMGDLAQKLGQGISISQQSRLIWDGEDDDQQEAIKEKKLKDVLNIEKDNRLQVVDMVSEETKMILWVLDSNEEEMELMDCKKENLKLKIEENLKKELKKRIRVVEQNKDIQNKNIEDKKEQKEQKEQECKVVKCIDLDDEEEQVVQKGQEKKNNDEAIIID